MHSSADQWPTEASVLATTILTNNDGAVNFTGTDALISTPISTLGNAKTFAVTSPTNSSASASLGPNAGVKLSSSSAVVAGTAVVIAEAIALI